MKWSAEDPTSEGMEGWTPCAGPGRGKKSITSAEYPPTRRGATGRRALGGSMWQETVRWGSLWVMAAAQLFFLDGPLLTIGQRWAMRRSHERNLLLGIELNFFVLWALLKFYMRWDPAPAPA